jgi:hypothetical protein
MNQTNTPPLSQEVLKQIQDWAGNNAQTEETTFDETRYCGLVDGAYEWATRCMEADLRYQISENSNKNWVKKVDTMHTDYQRLKERAGKLVEEMSRIKGIADQYYQTLKNPSANHLSLIANGALAAWTGNEDQNKEVKPYDRLESSIQGKAAIAFYEWMQRTSMTHTNIPLEIKYRMFADQMNAKDQKNKSEQ